MSESDYIDINRASWNNKVDVHIDSDFYDNANFLSGKSSLNQIELDLLGDVSGKRILHLQCHFGQDSISLQRMGAKVTGIDLSDVAISRAREMSSKLELGAEFIVSDVYSLPEVLDEQFDIVFTSYGTIGWLPDINKWANVVSKFLKPGGTFVFAEFHPVVWMHDDDCEKIIHRYFNDAAIIEEFEGTYAEQDSTVYGKYVTWNHALSEVISALINEGLVLEAFNEYDYSPYPFLSGMTEFESGKFRIDNFKDKVPLVYSLLMSS